MRHIYFIIVNKEDVISLVENYFSRSCPECNRKKLDWIQLFPGTERTGKFSCGKEKKLNCACPRDHFPVPVPVPVKKYGSGNPPLELCNSCILPESLYLNPNLLGVYRVLKLVPRSIIFWRTKMFNKNNYINHLPFDVQKWPHAQ